MKVTIYSILILFISFIISGCHQDPQIIVKEIYRMEIPTINISSPTFFKDHIYSAILTQETAYIQQFCLTDKNEKTLFISSYENATIVGISMNEKWAIWLDSDMLWQDNILYCENRLTGIIEIIYKPEDPRRLNPIAPSLSEDFVSWISFDGNKPKLISYNLETKEYNDISFLNTHGLWNNFPYSNGSNLLWTDSIEGQGYYYIYDLENRIKEEILSPFSFPSYAQIADNKVFSINFDNNGELDWTDQIFGYYDIENNIFKEIKIGLFINSFCVSDNYVAIIDNNNDLWIYDYFLDLFILVNSPTGGKAFNIDISSDGKLLVGWQIFLKEERLEKTIICIYEIKY